MFQKYLKLPGEKQDLLHPLLRNKGPQIIYYSSTIIVITHLLCIYYMSHSVKALFNVFTNLKCMIIIGILQTKKRSTDRLMICPNSPANERQSQDLNPSNLAAGPNYTEMPPKSREEKWYLCRTLQRFPPHSKLS